MVGHLVGEDPREEGEEEHGECRMAEPRESGVLETGSNRPRRNHRDDRAASNALRLFK
jgi:hypothetical protein